MKQALAAILCFLVSTAQGCSFPQRTDEELVRQSQNIFRAKVLEVKLVEMQDPEKSGRTFEMVEARYEVKEVIKGRPPASGIVRDVPFGPGNCGLTLLPGLEYVFFPGEHDMVFAPTGSFGYFNGEGTSMAPRLAAIRKLAAHRE
jgi:hypothetical protein